MMKVMTNAIAAPTQASIRSPGCPVSYGLSTAAARPNPSFCAAYSLNSSTPVQEADLPEGPLP